MDIQLLRTFLEVNKTRHFARAANNLYLTSAAVSARIKLLESQLGVKLFLRHRGNIQLTSEGERLVPHAETMLNAWARTLQEVQLQPEMEMRLHIGATSGLWLLAMENRLKELMLAMPALAIQAEGHSSDELVRKVLDRTLDMVLLYEPPTTSELKSEKIGQLNLILASNQSGISVPDALGDHYVYVDWGTAFAMFHARKFPDHTSSRMHVNLTRIALSLLKDRGGSAYFATSTVADEPWLHPVLGAPKFTRPVYVSYRESHKNLPLIEQVVAILNGLEI